MVEKYKWKVIAPVLILAVLAGAFWYGGGAPGLQGWTVEKDTVSPIIQTDSEPSPGITLESPAMMIRVIPRVSLRRMTQMPLRTLPRQARRTITKTMGVPTNLRKRRGKAWGAAPEVLRAVSVPRKRKHWRNPWQERVPAVRLAIRNILNLRAWSLIQPLERTNILPIRCRRVSLCRWSHRM